MMIRFLGGNLMDQSCRFGNVVGDEAREARLRRFGCIRRNVQRLEVAGGRTGGRAGVRGAGCREESIRGS